MLDELVSEGWIRGYVDLSHGCRQSNEEFVTRFMPVFMFECVG